MLAARGHSMRNRYPLVIAIVVAACGNTEETEQPRESKRRVPPDVTTLPAKQLRDTLSNDRRKVSYTIELPEGYERDPHTYSLVFLDASYRLPRDSSPTVHIEARESAAIGEQLLGYMIAANSGKVLTKRVLSDGVLLTRSSTNRDFRVTLSRYDPAHEMKFEWGLSRWEVLECNVEWDVHKPILDFERARAWAERVCLSMTIVR